MRRLGAMRSAKRFLTSPAVGHIIAPIMKNRFAILLVCILISPSVFQAQDSERGKAEAWGSLQISIIDRATGRPVTARCYLTDPTELVAARSGQLRQTSGAPFHRRGRIPHRASSAYVHADRRAGH